MRKWLLSAYGEVNAEIVNLPTNIKEQVCYVLIIFIDKTMVFGRI